jgi:hypothetical protein
MSPRYQSDIDLCSLCAEVVLSYFVQVQKWLLLIISLRHRSGINLSRSCIEVVLTYLVHVLKWY